MTSHSTRFLRFSFALLAIAALLVAPRAQAAPGYLSSDPESRLSTVPHDEAIERALAGGALRNISVRHEGWDETLFSWSRLKIHQLTGRTAIHGQDPVFTVLSLMYERPRWLDAQVIPIEHPRIAEIMGWQGKWTSVREVVENPASADLQDALQQAALRKEEHDALARVLSAVHQVRSIDPNREGIYEGLPEEIDAAQVRRLVEDRAARDEAHRRRVELARQVKQEKPFLHAGARLIDRAVLFFELPGEFCIIPDPASTTGEWIAPRQMHAVGSTGVQPAAFQFGDPLNLQGAAAAIDSAIERAFRTADPSVLDGAAHDFLRTVTQARAYPPEGYLLRKNFYVGMNPARQAAFLYALGVVLFALFLFFQARAWRIAATVVVGVGLALHTLDLALRLSLTGHMPVSNMYESIVFTAWSAMAIGLAIELWKRKGLAGLFVAIIGTLALIGVSLMPLHETRIHPLRAVLNSYWLNIHVTMMLISYGAFAVAALFAALYLVKSATKREALFGGKPVMPLDQIEEFAYRLVQVGWPILTVGVCLGAVWADTAWGRFWGWDPKETWAFITWITYTIYLHTRMVVGWRGRISAFACLLGFLMVLITWIGVSYIPWFAGGLHTYASPT